MATLTPEETATKLAELFVKEFGGKKRGRFSLPHDALRELSGRARLEGSVIERIGLWLLNNHRLVLVDCGPVFGVIDAQKVMAWRPVPRKLLGRRG